MSFENLGLDLKLLRILQKRGLSTPTAVQVECIQEALKGKDVIARSKTGSGKTLAYVLPALHKILSLPAVSQQAPLQALILVPTKELCLQVHPKISPPGILTEARSMTADDPLIACVLYAVQQALRTNLIRPQALQPHAGLHRPGLSSLVLDEADLILSMPGYEADLQTLAPRIPRGCQSMLLSATTNDSVQKLEKLILHNPVVLDLLHTSALDAAQQTSGEVETSQESSIDHFRISCSRQDKLLHVMALLKLNTVKRRVLLFVNSIEHAFKLKLFLEAFGLRSTVVNAEQPMNSRHHILQEFNKGIFDYLIAADCKTDGEENAETKPRPSRSTSRKRKREHDDEFGVTRGVDFKGVETVVVVDAPETFDEYVHRVGRTGRGGKSGTAVSLLTPEDADFAERLTKEISPSKEQLALRVDQGDEAASGVQEFSKLKKNSVEALRYRAEDIARSLTKRVIQEARQKDLRLELLNSQRLAAHFEANPGDMALLKHDKALAKRPEAPHLRHLPSYLRAAGMPISTGENGVMSSKKRKIHNRGVDPIKGGFLKAPKRGGKDDLTTMELRAEKDGKKAAKKHAKSQGKPFLLKRNVRKKR